MLSRGIYSAVNMTVEKVSLIMYYKVFTTLNESGEILTLMSSISLNKQIEWLAFFSLMQKASVSYFTKDTHSARNFNSPYISACGKITQYH